jgi:serine/threonine-protein kinase RsbW
MTEPLNKATGSFCICRLEEIERVRTWLKNELESHHYGRHDTFAVRLAFEEAVANAVTHGNRGDSAKGVTVELVVNDAKVEMTISDEGPGFDIAHLEDPTTEENIMREFGRGVMLMRGFMDTVRFNDTGNCVCLVKHRSPCPQS